MGKLLFLVRNHLRDLSMIEFQRPTESLVTPDCPLMIIGRLPGGKRNPITEPLMTTFFVIMGQVFRQNVTQRAFTKQNQLR